MENLEIREATQKDCGLILHFIKGLADYVGQPEYVTATEEKLRHTLFKKENNIYVRLAFLSEQPVGFALFFETYSTFKASAGLYIEDLFIFPEYRGKGLGRKLFQYIIDYGKQHGHHKVEWYVNNRNSRAIDFYAKMNAKKLDYKSIYYIEL